MILMCLGPYKTRTGHIGRSTGQWGHTKRRRDDGTAWAGVQAIQLFPVWMDRKVSNCIGEVSYG